ncbi:MAG: aminopeptidase P family protein [Acidimicrobiia bacterium]|nr:aminopeptidase P family protein [Acidimicrobiia bacterium]MYB74950.1 aminopeptidase P family protein [Acidimicrobiia bacterium]MYI00353.1 aminopeptidase P family protein [Acidimicrobiia bacterium]
MPIARAAPELELDVERLRRDRYAKLQFQMAVDGLDALVLLHAPHVAYATDCLPKGVDATHASANRPVAVVLAEQPQPCLLGGDPEGLDVDPHPAVWPDIDEGAADLGAQLNAILGQHARGGRVGIDLMTGAMRRTGVLSAAEITDAANTMGAVKLRKTVDELACIHQAQARTSRAMASVQEALVPGVRRSELAAVFLRCLREEGIDANMIDVIFQPMARRMADGPRTTTGHLAFPTWSGDPVYAESDLIWVDAGSDYHGYASDFGRTWTVDRPPTPAEQRCFERWLAVMDASYDAISPGASFAEVCAAATAADAAHQPDGERPWMPHFYLVHGVGIESAEMPFLGTDNGPDFDAANTLEPGMVMVLEPAIWEDGTGGYRAEEIVAVTENGWIPLGGGHPYDPFEVPR